MDKKLRIVAGAIVTESKLSKGAKTQLLNFIKEEATDVQVKALLLDGKIVTKIDEQTEEIINSRFKLKEVTNFADTYYTLSHGEYVTQSLLAAAAIIFMSWKILEKISTSKECKDYKGISKGWKICEKGVLIKKYKTQQNFIKNKMTLCKNTKNPDKCTKKLNDKISKLDTKIKKQEVSIKNLKKKS